MVDYILSTNTKYEKDRTTYLVTGSHGNIGSYIVEELCEQKDNINIICVDNMYNGNTPNLHRSFELAKDKNIFITENKKSYLYELAGKLKAEVVYHNNFIGGRYSVLSEVGMLPAELMGFNPNKFRQFNNLIQNKKYLDLLIQNTNSILYFSKVKKFNSIILNYDQKSNYLFQWYQQLVAESLGKKGKGILPIISNMPKDNHSVMQLYLDGFKNNFFTFFYCDQKQSVKLDKNKLLSSYKYLGSAKINEIMLKQKNATENVFRAKNIPFRSFTLKKRDEKTLGEIFCYFILETILLGRALKINPFDQPSVELIKKETKKLFYS